MLNKFEKGCFGPPGGGLGVPLYVIPRNLTPSGTRLMRKVLQDDTLAPFSSDKIRAKIVRVMAADKILADFGLRLWRALRAPP